MGKKVDAVKQGYQYGKDAIRKSYDTIYEAGSYVASGANISVLLFVLAIFLADIFVPPAFNRSTGSSLAFLLLYSLAGIFVYVKYKSEVDVVDLRKEVILRTLLSWGTPILIILVGTRVVPIIPNAYAAAITNYTGVWAMILLTYNFGWPRLIMSIVGEGKGFFASFARILNNVATFVIIFFFAAALFGGLQYGGVLDSLGVDSYDYETVSVGQITTQAGLFFVNLGNNTWNLATGRVNDTSSLFSNQFEQATARQYTGTVENQQGKMLGVRIQRQEALKPVFEFEQLEDGSVNVLDSQVIWFGEVEARTFADEFPVELSCVYADTRGEVIYQEPARPQELMVFFTGDAADIYPFECVMDMQSIKENTNEGTDLRGRFATVADFDFQTWGYATLSFIDRDILTELRRQGRNPARELNVDSPIVARYTPGPVSLGMFDRQQLPIGVTPQDPERTILPAFGVTLRNSWSGRGQVEELHRLVMQVPRPLMLDVNSCTGNVDAAGDPVYPEILSGLAEIPADYRWYEFTNLHFDEQQQLRTVRCPLAVEQNDYSLLIEQDLSAKQFTLVAQADYTYRSETVAPARLSLVRYMS